MTIEQATQPVVYDPFTPEFHEDPFPVYRRLRDEAPVYHNEKWGFWALSRYDDVHNALHDNEVFLNFEGIDLDDTNSQGGAGNIPMLDNPRHDQIRGVVRRHFMPRGIRQLENDIRDTTVALVDEFATRGRADIAQELSWPLPYEVFFDFIGLPQGDDREQLIEWSHGLKDRDPNSAALTPVAVEATRSSRVYLARMLEARRSSPRDDLLTHIVRSEIDGVPLAEDDIEPAAEVVGLVFGLYLAGIETTAGLLSTLFQELAAHPEQQRALRENPRLIPNAVEEGVRYKTPLQLIVRTVSRPVTLHGITIPQGSRVALLLGSANQDERRFDDPGTFNALRPAGRHLGFGEGLHGCLGNPLARLEARIALEVALPRLGEFRPAGPVRRYRSTPNAAVLDRLPISFDVR
jgi:cytochrome P450